MQIYLLRHGQTEYNAQHRYQGLDDFQIYDEKTAKEECIKMVRNIMEYWKAEAARIEQEQIL